VKVKTILGIILDGTFANSCWGAFIIDFCLKKVASKELRDMKFALTIKSHANTSEFAYSFDKPLFIS